MASKVVGVFVGFFLGVQSAFAHLIPVQLSDLNQKIQDVQFKAGTLPAERHEIKHDVGKLVFKTDGGSLTFTAHDVQFLNDELSFSFNIVCDLNKLKVKNESKIFGIVLLDKKTHRISVKTREGAWVRIKAPESAQIRLTKSPGGLKILAGADLAESIANQLDSEVRRLFEQSRIDIDSGIDLSDVPEVLKTKVSSFIAGSIRNAVLNGLPGLKSNLMAALNNGMPVGSQLSPSLKAEFSENLDLNFHFGSTPGVSSDAKNIISVTLDEKLLSELAVKALAYHPDRVKPIRVKGFVRKAALKAFLAQLLSFRQKFSLLTASKVGIKFLADEIPGEEPKVILAEDSITTEFSIQIYSKRKPLFDQAFRMAFVFGQLENGQISLLEIQHRTKGKSKSLYGMKYIKSPVESAINQHIQSVFDEIESAGLKAQGFSIDGESAVLRFQLADGVFSVE